MEPSDFKHSNFTFDTPRGASVDEVRPIRAYRGADANGRPMVVTCWKPTREELDEIERNGRVWIVVLGHSLLPMAVMGKSPWVDGAID